MPSGLRKTSGNHFEIYYEAPWGGVASDKSPVDIEPNQFVECDGLSIRNGLLCYCNFASQNSKYDLELITPTNIAPYGSGGSGAYVNVNVTEILGLLPTFGNPAVYAGRQYFLASSAGLSSGTTFTISGTSIAQCNITDTIAQVPNGTQVLSNTPIAASVILDGSNGGILTYYDPTAPGTPVPQNWPNAYICLIFNCGNYLCALDQYGFSYIATLQTDGTIKFQLDQIAADGPSTNHGIPTCVQVVAGSAYISFYSSSTLYVYTPTVAYIVASTYAAGQFINIFDEYMLLLNTNSPTDGEQPTNINWSSPDEFTTWDPAVNRTAGFQLLTSVEDYISGFIAVDNVGYIFKREGVTQITTTGVAIQPFNFTTYWNSVGGQGLIFSQTLVQWGRITFLATDSDFYGFYGGAFTSIGVPATAAIFASFNQEPTLSAASNNLITAGFSLYPFNDRIPTAEYIFIAASSSVAGNIVFWFYQPNAKTWTSLTVSAASLLADYVGAATDVIVNSIQTALVFPNYITSNNVLSISNLNTLLVYINFTYTEDGNNYTDTLVFFYLVNSPSADITNVTIPPGTINLVFRQEEIKLGRQPTIRRVIIKACGSGTLVLSVSGVSFGSITLDGTSVQKTYKSNAGVYTGEDPQLTITSNNFIGQITKVMLSGTYADGDID